jgi:hypothetical protein
VRIMSPPPSDAPTPHAVVSSDFDNPFTIWGFLLQIQCYRELLLRLHSWNYFAVGTGAELGGESPVPSPRLQGWYW